MATEYLYVNVFDKALTQWTEVPSLNGYVYLASIDYPTEYIQSEGVENQEEGWFGFQNLPSSGEITLVWLEVYCRKTEGNATFTAFVDDGTGSIFESNMFAASSWGWVILVLTSHLDTSAKVNNAKVKFRSYQYSATDATRTCDSFDNTKTGWDRYGTSPYLKYPTSYVETKGKDEIGDFGFGNIPTELVTVTAAKLQIRSFQIPPGNDNIRIYIWDESAGNYVNLGTITPASEGWQTIDVFSWINTPADVNAAKIYMAHEAVGAANTVTVNQAQLLISYTQQGKQQIDCARLKVEYTPEVGKGILAQII